ncbi:hypothetical protein ACSBR2_000380 [Camellia fascicularis]
MKDVICMESEKLALSRFKQDLKDPSSRLSSWDVEDDCYYNWISVPDLEWLHGLSHLEHLDLRGVYLRKTPNWVQVINKLPSLVELHLSNCGLDYIPSLFDVNSTSLAILDLSFNQFASLIPRSLQEKGAYNTEVFATELFPSQKANLKGGFEGPVLVAFLNMTNLEHLDLSNNKLGPCLIHKTNSEGTFPMVLPNMTSLRYLDLSLNKLEGRLPRSLGNLCNLSFINLSYNNFSGELFRSSSKCAKYALESLFLYGNKLSGLLTDELKQFKNVRDLILGGNLFSGPIPINLGRLMSLERLVLDGNQLNGTLPQSLGHLSKLKHFDVSNNLLEGIVFEAHFTNIINLREFYASRNRLTLKVSPNWIPPFQLEEVELASWNLGPKFPIWVQSQKNLGYLDLSNTGISDRIPIWFWNSSSSLYFLDLSHNQIYGEIP